MAAFNGVNYARTIAVPVVKIPPGEIKGEIKVSYDEYTTLANLGAADTINTGIVVPAGARVKAVTVVNPTNGGTITVGIAGTTAKYGTFTPGSVATPYLGAANTVDEVIFITCTVAATAVGAYRIMVEWVKL